jgi:hypothetical protein
MVRNLIGGIQRHGLVLLQLEGVVRLRLQKNDGGTRGQQARARENTATGRRTRPTNHGLDLAS